MFYMKPTIFPSFERSGLNISSMSLSASIFQIPDIIKNSYTAIQLSEIEIEFKTTLDDWVLDGKENIWKIKHCKCSDQMIKFYSDLIDYFKSDDKSGINKQSFVVDFMQKNNDIMNYSTKYHCTLVPTEIDRKEDYSGNLYIVCELRVIPYYE